VVKAVQVEEGRRRKKVSASASVDETDLDGLDRRKNVFLSLRKVRLAHHQDESVSFDARSPNSLPDLNSRSSLPGTSPQRFPRIRNEILLFPIR